jgi:hypothetical protein
MAKNLRFAIADLRFENRRAKRRGLNTDCGQSERKIDGVLWKLSASAGFTS